jgi:hypothetical protein
MPAFDPAIARAEAMKQHPTARPSTYVVLAALAELANNDIVGFQTADDILARFTDEERALAAVELDAWLEAQS